METHELFATITSWIFVFLAAARLFLGAGKHRRWMAAYLACMAAGCVLLVITGHKGAMLVYHHGAGVQLGTGLPLPTHEDLAVLRQKQDPEALWYSDNMHHVFGWMVLAFSGLLLVEMVSPDVGARLRKVAPALLLAGGVFLMIRSDADSWPLSNRRPITDKEVLMHKAYAVLMLGFGFAGLRRGRRRGLAPATVESALADRGEPAGGDKYQGRRMAVFSLIGGALLFTHVHSNAPYANAAVGVYLHHTVMGCIALCIGAVKLLEDSWSAMPTRLAARGLAVAYPCLMLAESIFLLNYNEGLPWFLGYGRLSPSAPHRGLIAPLGPARAELVYDAATTRLDLYLLRQSDDRAYAVPASEVQIVTRVGTESTSVNLTQLPETAGGAHFSGSATFLRGVGMFQARAIVRGAGAGSRHELVADFEPWTDRASASSHRSQSAYVCPMHPAVGAGAPGTCPVCGMALVRNKGARPPGRLHDAEFSMDLAMAPAAPGKLTRLVLTPRREGAVVTALDVVHSKKLHLIVTSRDLNYFDHVHPLPRPDGSLVLAYVFPAAGEYVLFADCTPSGDRNQVFPIPVTVPGAAGAAQPLEPTQAQAKAFGDYRVRLDLSPDPAQPGDETQLTFHISRNGVPVIDLQPYLGAGGHCVAISEDLRAYAHSHPQEMGEAGIGPAVTFQAVFPKSGLYKIWGQFMHRGKPLIADFVVRVP
jgi:hypothetical protein